MPLDEREGDAVVLDHRAQAVGDARPVLHFHRAARRHPVGEDGAGPGLHAPHREVRVRLPERDGRPADEPAAADAGHQRGGAGEVPGDLEAHRAAAGDDRGVVVGGDEREPVACRLGPRGEPGLLHRSEAGERRTEPLHHRHLPRVGRVREEDPRRDAEGPGRPGEADAVPARGGGDHPPGPLGGPEREQLAERDPRLEAAGHLPALQLEEHLRAQVLAENGRRLQRGVAHVRPDALGRALHVAGGDRGVGAGHAPGERCSDTGAHAVISGGAARKAGARSMNARMCGVCRCGPK